MYTGVWRFWIHVGLLTGVQTTGSGGLHHHVSKTAVETDSLGIGHRPGPGSKPARPDPRAGPLQDHASAVALKPLHHRLSQPSHRNPSCGRKRLGLWGVNHWVCSRRQRSFRVKHQRGARVPLNRMDLQRPARLAPLNGGGSGQLSPILSAPGQLQMRLTGRPVGRALASQQDRKESKRAAPDNGHPEIRCGGLLSWVLRERGGKELPEIIRWSVPIYSGRRGEARTP
jgi:hypothetical protein